MKRLLSIVVALLLSAAACVEVVPAPTPTPDTVRTQIKAMLRQRLEALNAGDIDSYLRPVAPNYTQLERQIYEGAKTMPISNFDLTLHPGQSFISETELKGAQVSLSFAYDDLPVDNTFRITFIYDFKFAGGDWTIIRSVPVQGLALPAWATGPTLFTRSEHFLVLFRPHAEGIQDIIDMAEAARSSIEDLPLELDEVMLITLATSPAEYADFTSATFGASSIAQAETVFEIIPQRIKAISRGVVINLPRLAQTSDHQATLRHEMVHIAFSSLTLPFTPAWVGESAAMYFAGQRPTETWRRGVRERRFQALSFSELATRSALGAHDATGLTASFEYAYASAASHYLIETYGVDAYLNFYRSYARVPADEVYERLPDDGIEARRSQALVALGAATTQEALREVFGLTEAELDVAVRDWIAEQI